MRLYILLNVLLALYILAHRHVLLLLKQMAGFYGEVKSHCEFFTQVAAVKHFDILA